MDGGGDMSTIKVLYRQKAYPLFNQNCTTGLRLVNRKTSGFCRYPGFAVEVSNQRQRLCKYMRLFASHPIFAAYQPARSADRREIQFEHC